MQTNKPHATTANAWLKKVEEGGWLKASREGTVAAMAATTAPRRAKVIVDSAA